MLTWSLSIVIGRPIGAGPSAGGHEQYLSRFD
jgi:hypothetical protein